MLHISLFSGIGGFDLAAQWAGWTNVASCEIAEFPRKVLQYHFPQAYHHDDIHTLTYEKLDCELETRFGKEWRSDDIILSGGFPCQPYSVAGKRQGTEDARHLWPEMLRVIREVRPRWVVGENVFGLVNWNGGLVFDEVQSDLEAAGYEVQAFILPACSVGAPHRRDRVWFVAHANHERRGAGLGEIQKTDGEVSERHNNAKHGDTSNDFIAHSNGGATRSSGSCREFKKCWGYKFFQQNKWGKEAKQYYRFYEFPQFAPHAGGLRLQGRVLSSNRAPAKQHIEPQNTRGDKCKTWHDFPTQPPICSGDDGVPFGLDGITFSKWRNESLKGYGNAIVPQVAYRIFSTINEYELKMQISEQL